MHVIGHHHKCIQNIAVTIEVPQCLNYDFSNVGFFEKTFAMSLVEPMFTIVLKSLLVFVFRRGIPRFGMKLSPGV
jgi:riboflavin transporter FmnP